MPMKRRLLPVLLILSLLLPMVPQMAFAAPQVVDVLVYAQHPTYTDDFGPMAVPLRKEATIEGEAQYTWSVTPEGGIWIQFLGADQPQVVRIVPHVMLDDVGFVDYAPLIDEANSDWLTVTGSDLFPVTGRLKVGEEVVYTTSVTAANYAQGEPSTGPVDPPPEVSPDIPEEPVIPPEAVPQIPAHETDYARIQLGSAVLYSDMFGQEVVTLQYDTKLQLNITDQTPAKVDGDGRTWVPVRRVSDGMVGYLMVDAISFLTVAEVNDLALGQDMQTPETNYLEITNEAMTVYDINGIPLGNFNVTDVVRFHAGEPNAVIRDVYGNRMILVTLDKENGLTGYIRDKDGYFYNHQQYDDYQQRVNPSDPPTEPPTVSPSPTPTASATATATATASQTAETPSEPVVTPATPTPSPIPQLEASYYGIITGKDVYVRSAAGGSVMRTSKQNEVVRVEQVVTDGAGTQWLAIRQLEVEGEPIGYISPAYVREATPTEIELYLKSKVTVPPAVTASPTPTPSPTPVPTPLSQVAGYMRVNTSYVALFSFPGIGAATLAVLNFGDVVYVAKQETDIYGNLYHLVQTNGRTGYVLASQLTAMTTQEVLDYFNRQTPTTPPVATYSPNAFSGFALLTSDNVNIRTGPSVDTSRVVQLKQGTIVRVLDTVTAESTLWYKVESNGRTGYIRGDLLSTLTTAQYSAIVSQQSYNQNGNIITPTSTAKINTNTWTTTNPQSTVSFITMPPMATTVPSATPEASATPTFVPFATIAPVTDNPNGGNAEIAKDIVSVYEANGDFINNYQKADITLSSGADTTTRTSNGTVLLKVTINVENGRVGYIQESDVRYGNGTATPSPNPFTTLPPESTDFTDTKSGGFSPPGILLVLVVLLVLAAGGLYGYSVYNKARRKQAQEQARRLAQEKRTQGPDGKGPQGPRPGQPTQGGQPPQGGAPAVRRPVPPAGTVPPTGAAGAPGTPGAARPGAGAPGTGAPAAPNANNGAAGQTRPAAGTPGASAGANGQARPAAGTPAANGQRLQGAQPQGNQANPYMRPQQPQKPAQPPQPPKAEAPVQRVNSTLPRAEVDGKPADQTPAARMPQAPDPVAPDDPTAAAPRRRRSRPEGYGDERDNQ